MNAKEIEALAREVASQLFSLSRDGKDNIAQVKTFDLKTMARKVHGIAEVLKTVELKEKKPCRCGAPAFPGVIHRSEKPCVADPCK